MAIVMTFIIVLISFVIILKSRWIWDLNQARRKGLYPKSGRATLFDVQNMLKHNEKELAIRVYAEIFRTNYQDAKKAIDELERSLPTTNPGSDT
jgi:hypothetical protein